LVLIVFSYTVADKNWCMFPYTLLLLDEDVTPKLNSYIIQTHTHTKYLTFSLIIMSAGCCFQHA
jgi:hypothetical protein